MNAQTSTETPSRFTYVAPVFCVADITRSLAFYRDRLGFAIEFVYEDFYAGVVRDGCHIHLKCAPRSWAEQAGLGRDEHIDAQIAVEAIEGLAADLSSRGASFLVPLRDMAYGSEFYVRDPDGYVLAFVEPHRATDGDEQA